MEHCQGDSLKTLHCYSISLVLPVHTTFYDVDLFAKSREILKLRLKIVFSCFPGESSERYSCSLWLVQVTRDRSFLWLIFHSQRSQSKTLQVTLVWGEMTRRCDLSDRLALTNQHAPTRGREKKKTFQTCRRCHTFVGPYVSGWSIIYPGNTVNYPGSRNSMPACVLFV